MPSRQGPSATYQHALGALPSLIVPQTPAIMSAHREGSPKHPLSALAGEVGKAAGVTFSAVRRAKGRHEPLQAEEGNFQA